MSGVINKNKKSLQQKIESTKKFSQLDECDKENVKPPHIVNKQLSNRKNAFIKTNKTVQVHAQNVPNVIISSSYKSVRQPLKEIFHDEHLNKNTNCANLDSKSVNYNTKRISSSPDNKLTVIHEESFNEIETKSDDMHDLNQYVEILNRTNFITREREYDCMDLTSTSFFDIIDNSNSFIDENEEVKNESIDNSSAAILKNINEPKNNKLLMNEICTPANTLAPESNIIAIKEIRKCVSKAKNIDSVNLNELSLKEGDQKDYLSPERFSDINVSNNVHLLRKKRISKHLSPLYLPDEKTKSEKKSHQAAYVYNLLGVVYLDNKENYVVHSVLYSTPYLKHIVNYQLKKEYKHYLSEDFLKKFSITNSNRAIVINWLIKLQAYMKTEHSLVHTAVRIMDRTLDSIDIPLNMLQLVAVASYWISLKYHSVDHKEVSWMVKQTCGAYTNDQLIMMEKEVFKANNFDVNAIDFSIFIHYYILKLKLSGANIVAQCAHYLLDCALLDSRFVRILPSLLAAGTVFTSLHLMNQYDEKAWNTLEMHSGFYGQEELKSVKESLIEILKEVNDPSFPCREPYYKYSSSRYYSVTQIFSNIPSI